MSILLNGTFMFNFSSKYSSLCITLVFLLGAIVGVYAGPSKNILSELLVIMAATGVFHMTHSATIKLSLKK